MLSGLRSRDLLRRWWLTEKKLVPIVASIFRLEDFREAFKAMTKRSASKMIVRIERSSGAARMAPLLHHFQQNGWTELQIMIRFWIISWCWRSPAAPHSNSVDDDSPTRHAIAWLWASFNAARYMQDENSREHHGANSRRLRARGCLDQVAKRANVPRHAWLGRSVAIDIPSRAPILLRPCAAGTSWPHNGRLKRR